MHQYFAFFSIHLVSLALGDVVRHVIHHPKLRIAAQNFAECAARKMGDRLTIRPCKIRGRCHRAQIIFPLFAVHRDAGKLAIGQLDGIAAHRFIHRLQKIGAHLVPQPARAAVDQHHHLVQTQSETFRDFRL